CDLLGSNTCEPTDTCGNGTLETGESCDDGNLIANDGCTLSCLREDGEACTNDAQCTGVCDLLGSNTCEPTDTCGNGTLETGESCDDGNLISNDGCTLSCVIEDGGACTDDAQCTGVCDLLGSNTCEPTDTCGNGTLDAGESCDDGNLIANDGCAHNCLIENGGVCNAPGDCDSGVCDALGNAPALCEAADTCGNGFVDASEGCDDGNLISNDGCSLSCDAELGQPCSVDDDCDSGVCDSTQTMAVCELPDVCGNGLLESGEGCDDGNLSGGDGCGSSCQVENGNACNATSPGDVGASSCISSSCIDDLCVASNRCADGVVDPGEGCDDGNLNNGDSCNSNCLIETGNPCSTDDSCASGICDASSGSGMCEPSNACGNGVLETGEGCDDGNTIDGDACSANCFIEDGVACGLVAPGLMSGASCVSNFCDDVTLECTTAANCGDGVLDPGEGCDDGNNVDADGCNSFCFLEDGQSCNQTSPGSLLDFSCASGNCDDGTCEPLNTCGNGLLEAGEGCDDSNTTDSDGCDSSCFLEDAIACNVQAPGNIGDDSCASGLCNDSAGVPGFCAAVDTCGNSSLDPGEGCDDGNLQTGDGCDQLCLIEDGMDCHASLGNSSCASDFCDMSAGQPGTCEPANTCGNGTLEAGEGCDDGNTTASDGCSSDCLIENGQLCNDDDQGAIGNASCDSAACDPGRNVCVPGGVCGNTILEPGEGCDDGNTANDDGCSSDCKIERGLPCNVDSAGATGNLSCETGLCNTGGGNPGVCQVLPGCGNGVLEAGEGCDDGNANDGDGCSLSCLVEVGSSCNSDAEGITGDASCLSQRCDTGNGVCIADCGNGMAEVGEGCDDGNQDDGDGCTATCLIEPGGACMDDQECQSGRCEAGVCSALESCGDGELAANEGCDDGNLVSGDGCNQFCKIEFLSNCSSDTDGLTGANSCASGICDTSDGAPGICTKDDNEDGFNDHLGLAGGGCQASGTNKSGWLFLLVMGLLLYRRRRKEADDTLNETQEGATR
ncbi:MAG: DUF4215 domain-containing protein, partial [Kofleriaceae bacterium]|nr:DUF4215 domain-containing protein [Kofleriaceae bacterium]